MKGLHRMSLEALASLKALGKQLRIQLLESPEFRALEVVDRTILELTEIMDSCAPPPAIVRPPAPVAAPPNDPPAAVREAAQAAEPAVSGATTSQSRMAKAIAATIAANTASRNVSATSAARFSHVLSAAS
jgi:hypothetical protein